jgi:hypothetical protein
LGKYENYKFLIPALAIIALAGCSSRPKISLSISEEKGQTIFHIPTKGVNAITDLRIWQADTRDILWDIKLGNYIGEKLAYGDIPLNFRSFNGGKYSAKQKYPAENQKPSVFPASSRLIVVFHLQYDNLYSARQTSRWFSLSTDSAGRVEEITPINWLPYELSENDKLAE